MTSKPHRRLRCAVYTRKSSEEGLEQGFNSLDAQREACTAYIASQKHEGWSALPERYDDGGYSGGTMERPALQRLLEAIAARQVDVVVVYKVDRLTRALTDFSRIIDVLDKAGASFVSVTQQFNTTTSMGRLTLNVLLSFAQFEREVTGERIRDKIAASKRKGLWMGGYVPFGYRAAGRTLVAEPSEAAIVKLIFTLYLELGSVRGVEDSLARRNTAIPGRSTKAGRIYGARSFSRGQLYKMLSNPIYCGEIRHRSERHRGQHPAIIAPETFSAVADRLAANTHERKTGSNSRAPSLLAGLLVDEAGATLVPTHASKQGKRYRYYISRSRHEGRRPGRPPQASVGSGSGWRLSASEIEPLVIGGLRSFLEDEVGLMDFARTMVPPTALSIELRSRLAHSAAGLASELLSEDPAAIRATLLRLIARVELAANAISVILDGACLTTELGIPIEQGSPREAAMPRILIPIALRRRGVETKLILTQDDRAAVEPDATMLRALARARRWMNELIDGTHLNVSALAAAYRTNPHYVARHLPLACLAPSIVEAILSGRRPVLSDADGQRELTTWDLLNRIDVLLDWQQQKRTFGLRD